MQGVTKIEQILQCDLYFAGNYVIGCNDNGLRYLQVSCFAWKFILSYSNIYAKIVTFKKSKKKRREKFTKDNFVVRRNYEIPSYS